jgi:microsomal prostaglandin-E synthase 1
MDNIQSFEALYAYAVAALVLSLNMIIIWSYSGYVRFKTKTTHNIEDAVRFKTTVEEHDPPDVARVLRVMNNAQANVVPFLILGLVFVLIGGPGSTARMIFGLFTVARLLHSIVYLAAKQPWRTIFYSIGAGATGWLIVAIIMKLAQGSFQ